MSAGKKHIRKSVLINRRLLAPEVFQHRNDLLLNQVRILINKYSPAQVHCFLPIETNKEVNTWPIIELLRGENTQLIVSATDFALEQMTHFRFTDELAFENDQFGIPTPIGGELADLQRTDLIFIPLLATDKKGNRVGYGKGYYDRLLPLMKTDTIKVGLNLCPAFDLFPFVEEQDVPLDCIITPQEIIFCT